MISSKGITYNCTSRKLTYLKGLVRQHISESLNIHGSGGKEIMDPREHQCSLLCNKEDGDITCRKGTIRKGRLGKEKKRICSGPAAFDIIVDLNVNKVMETKDSIQNSGNILVSRKVVSSSLSSATEGNG